MNTTHKGRIVKIEKHTHNIAYGVTGIKKAEQWKYHDKTGGNGTYITGGESYPPTVDFKVWIYDLEKAVDIDLYEEILQKNGKKRLSPQLLNYIIEQNKGKKVRLYQDNGEWHIHPKDVELIRN